MDVKQLKASLQLAEMNHTADPSEGNAAVLEKARADYESAQEGEVGPTVAEEDEKPEPSKAPAEKQKKTEQKEES